ncbi:MAG: tRNA dihydrouridine(20/20a) synthase DusA [Pseudomonadota bacterium]
MSKKHKHVFSVAPMMDWTDRHCRVFHRAFSRRARLYTEMVTAPAILHGDQEKLIGFSDEEHPIALQLGGSDPESLAKAARIGADRGYDEINLNCGCPSDRVQSGAFGACLMREPDTVARCVSAIAEAVDIPVTVKCRIGVDDDDPKERLFGFVDTVANAGCDTFIIHARKAWLSGLSPKENRDIPPLDYPLVRALKAERPDLTIALNGGLETHAQALTQSQTLDGVMLGRAAYQTPEILGDVDRVWFDAENSIDAMTAIQIYRPYMADQLARDVQLHAMTRHMLGAFAGRPGARKWRRILSEHAPGAKGLSALSILDEALSAITSLQAAAE